MILPGRADTSQQDRLIFCTQLPVADFPDAFRANLWVRGLSQDSSADEALADFKVQIWPSNA